MARSITRDDIRWWVYLAAILVGVVLWGSRLEGRVSVLDERTTDRGAKLREEDATNVMQRFMAQTKTIRTDVSDDTIHLDFDYQNPPNPKQMALIKDISNGKGILFDISSVERGDVYSNDFPNFTTFATNLKKAFETATKIVKNK